MVSRIKIQKMFSRQPLWLSFLLSAASQYYYAFFGELLKTNPDNFALQFIFSYLNDWQIK